MNVYMCVNTFASVNYVECFTTFEVCQPEPSYSAVPKGCDSAPEDTDHLMETGCDCTHCGSN